jgi:hypothetical protein
MANRRDFLIATGTSAGLAAFSLLGSACAPPPPVPPPGYAVGQRMPVISGRNAFGGTSRSTELRGSWVLVDLCPWWCTPCLSSAQHQTEFIRYLRGAGINLRMLAVVVEDPGERPAERFDAERWAARFGLNSEIVLHCDGDAASPLRDLVRQFAAPTGATPGYPTYVLLDPAGVIRGYFTTSDLNVIQAALATLTRKQLTRTWEVGNPVTEPNSLMGTVQVTGRSLSGATIDNSLELDSRGAAVGPDVSVFPFDFYGPLLNSFGTGVLAYTSFDPETGAVQPLQFDPDSPVTLTYRPVTPPAGVRFRRAIGTTAELLLVPDDAFAEFGAIDESKTLAATGTVSEAPDGWTLTVPATRSLLGERTFSFFAVRQRNSPLRWAMPYTLADELIEDVATRGFAPPDVVAITSDLRSVQTALGARNYAAAATAGRSAAGRVAAAGAALELLLDVQLLEQQLTAAAAGV